MKRYFIYDSCLCGRTTEARKAESENGIYVKYEDVVNELANMIDSQKEIERLLRQIARRDQTIQKARKCGSCKHWYDNIYNAPTDKCIIARNNICDGWEAMD